MFFFKCFSENYRNIHESGFFFLKIASSFLLNKSLWVIHKCEHPFKTFGMSSVGYQWMDEAAVLKDMVIP